MSPLQIHKSQFLSFLFLFVFINFTTAASAPITQSSDFEPLYSQHCNAIVPKSETDPSAGFVSSFSIQDIGFQNNYFTGGDGLFGNIGTQKSLSFSPSNLGKTLTGDVFKVGATLHLTEFNSVVPKLQLNNQRRRRFPSPKWQKFRLDGYYSESSKKLCMVGKGGWGSKNFFGSKGGSKFNPRSSVVLKLNYPHSSSIYDSLITGTLESLHDKNNSYYFKPILMLALSQRSSYEYALAAKDSENSCLAGYDGDESLSLLKSKHDFCDSVGRLYEKLELEYGNDCESSSCNPLSGNVGYVSAMVYQVTRCTDERKTQMRLGFSNSSYAGKSGFDPSTTFIAEGAWDEKENRLCAVACRILNFTESLAHAFVGDCSARLSLRFPAVLSLQNRSNVVGKIWSSKEVNDSGYFGKIGFHGFSRRVMRYLDFKYEYSENNVARKTCSEKKDGRGNGKTYPDVLSLKLNFQVEPAFGFAHPLFVDDEQIFGRRFLAYFPGTDSPMQSSKIHTRSNPINVSYMIYFMSDFDFRRDAFPSKPELSAEGVYDRDYGNLCMTGCRRVPMRNQTWIQKNMLDCAININVQVSPLDSKDGQTLKGTIQSARGKLDPFYFEPIEFSYRSMYTSQAAASISRIDIEIIMVLVSNTLACVFVGLQLSYVKKHPDFLPYMSIVMLIVLTLGFMIPLVANFEALFLPNNHHNQDTFLGIGRWLQVNQVIVRLVTMVALLLQLLLLQLTWSSRQGSDGSQTSLRDSERKVLYATLPLYIAGALIVWFVHLWKIRYQKSYMPFTRRPHHNAERIGLPSFYHLVHPQHSLWSDLGSYGGFILDGFLFPQILFNLFFNSGEKALAFPFYFGTTVTRLLPHAYDLYRAQRTATWFLNLSMVYANHRMDFYSTAWNIIIPCVGLLLAAIVFLQQRFGGRCFLPKRFRQTSVYEKVPVISNQEL